MAKVSEGETVIVSSGYRDRRYWRAIVVWVGRVWMQVVAEEDHGDLRATRHKFRLDTQGDGSEYSPRSRFYTLEQYVEKQQQDEAASFLKSQGVTLTYDSPWRKREVELASIICAAMTQEEK